VPRYTYECSSCSAIFEHRHSMTDVLDKCVKCESERIMKRVSDFSLTKDKEPNSSSEAEAGTEVKKFIEEAKKEIKEERETLSSRIVE
jgi:putative FmdB family regulatory protein